MTFAAAIRDAAVTLLSDYAASAGIRLQVYRGRPSSLYVPTAFVDSVGERIAYLGPSLLQRRQLVEVVVLHGRFDSGETVDQRDAFVDGFVAWCAARYHQAGANTLLGLVAVDDEPTYVPDWVPTEKQVVYFATRLTLEGLAET